MDSFFDTKNIFGYGFCENLPWGDLESLEMT